MHQHSTKLSAAISAAARLWLVLIIFSGSTWCGDEEKADEVVPIPADAVPLILLGNGLFNGDFGESENSTGERVPIPPPVAAAKPGAFILRWNQYSTTVVIDDSAGLVKGCWIVTLTTMPEQIHTERGPVMLVRGQVVVAYRGQAYYDKQGTLQIDARGAKLSGSMREIWSPDSFSISPDKQVDAHDDNPSNPIISGEIEKEVSAEMQKAEYQKLRFAAEAIISGVI